jgi:predicted nucleotide-binding protein
MRQLLPSWSSPPKTKGPMENCTRMNVIHEAGLFQGRLGFTRAIVMLEEGCEEFSNIEGLGQIRFPNNNIKAAFHDFSLCSNAKD